MSAGSPSAIDDILAEYSGLEQQMSDPALHNDAGAARRVGKRFAELAPIMATHRKLESAREDLAAAR
ncbi:PCRF domain-containing protein, partial [Tsukamurella strandjordii]